MHRRRVRHAVPRAVPQPRLAVPGFAILFFAIGLAAITTGEFIREAVRKPYILYNVVLGNQILPEEIPELRRSGYLEGGTWTKAFVPPATPR